MAASTEPMDADAQAAAMARASSGFTVLVSTTTAPGSSAVTRAATTARDTAGEGSDSTTAGARTSAGCAVRRRPGVAAAAAARWGSGSWATTGPSVASRPATAAPMVPSPNSPTTASSPATPAIAARAAPPGAVWLASRAMARTPEEQLAWLDRTVEAPLDPQQEIVDPHHHLWDHRQPRYLLDDLLADTGAGHRVVQTVFIECGWSYDRGGDDPVLAPVGETAQVAAVAGESERRGGSVIAGIVGHADLGQGAEAGRALDALAEAGGGRFVGIRHATAQHGDDRVRNHRIEPPPGVMGEATWRAGFAELARRGLTYDAWLYHPQIPELTALAAAFPDTTIVADHLGGPLGVGPFEGRRDEVLAECRASLAELARQPNVALKLGGIGMPIMGGGWEQRERPPTSEELADAWGPHLRWCIDTFGAERSMFESNFPVDKESVPYTVLWNAFQRVAADAGASEAERAALFAGTARRVYGLDAPAGPLGARGRARAARDDEPP